MSGIEVEEHAAHGREFFGGADCLCQICVASRNGNQSKGMPTEDKVELLIQAQQAIVKAAMEWRQLEDTMTQAGDLAAHDLRQACDRLWDLRQPRPHGRNSEESE